MNNKKGQIAALLLLIAFLSSCATLSHPYNLEFMPPPEIFDDEVITPFRNAPILSDNTILPILYATTRKPAKTTSPRPFYENERGQLTRLGQANIKLIHKDKNWDDLTRFSEIRETRDRESIYVDSVQEYGILNQDFTLLPQSLFSEEDKNKDAETPFLYELNKQLNHSENRDIYIFVHGFNVNFENPLLMASQFSHYLGYRGAFIAFSWPSFHNVTDYAGDIDSAISSAKALRELLSFLAEKSDVEKIHIIGYSAGTRLATLALNQISLQHQYLSKEESQKITKLGSLILLASDMDRELFGTYLLDGLLNTVDQINVYISEADQMLKASHLIHSYPRLGEKWHFESLIPETKSFLEKENEKLHIIDVSNAHRIATRGGHFYFLDSPWVSSDVLMALYSGASPEERALEKHPDQPYWYFPDDYISRLKGRFKDSDKPCEACPY